MHTYIHRLDCVAAAVVVVEFAEIAIQVFGIHSYCVWSGGRCQWGVGGGLYQYVRYIVQGNKHPLSSAGC